jgi:hypothetical protein
MFCTDCEKDRDVEFLEYGEVVNLNGLEVPYLGKSYICTVCYEKLETSESFKNNLESFKKAYKKLKDDV